MWPTTNVFHWTSCFLLCWHNSKQLVDLTQYTVAIAAPIVEARLGATPLDVSRITACFTQSFVTMLAQEYTCCMVNDHCSYLCGSRYFCTFDSKTCLTTTTQQLINSQWLLLMRTHIIATEASLLKN